MPGIFELEDELVRIAEAFDALEAGEESIEVLAAVEGYFAQLLGDRDKKVDGYCRLIADYQGKAKVKKAEADRLAAAAKADESAAERLKGRLRLFMEANAMTRLEGALHKVAIQPNGGRLPLVVDEPFASDPLELPKWAQAWTAKLDADAVRDFLERLEADVAERLVAYRADQDERWPVPRTIEDNAAMEADLAEFESMVRNEVYARNGMTWARLGERGTHVRIR